MALFTYSGYDVQGKKVRGTTDASSEKAAIGALKAQGIFPTELKAGGVRSRISGPGLSFGLRRQPPLADLATMNRQLATLVTAGLSLDDALEILIEQTLNPQLGPALREVRQAVVEGAPFSAALAQHPTVFPKLLPSMIDVGEQSGRLGETLLELADYLDNQARIRSKVQNSLAYPVLMAAVGIGVLAFLFVYVMPKIVRIVQDLETDLPLPTQILLGVSHSISRFWWLGALLLVVGIVLLWRYRHTEAGRLTTDRLWLKAPLIGPLITLQLSARFSRTLATLLQAGVPLLQALETCRNLAANRVYHQTLDQTLESVREGGAMAPPLHHQGIFPTMMLQMVAIGEESGELDQMLVKVAESFEHQFDIQVNRFLALLEPLMILFMGGVVGFIVLSILLPIFEASQGLG